MTNIMAVRFLANLALCRVGELPYQLPCWTGSFSRPQHESAEHEQDNSRDQSRFWKSRRMNVRCSSA